MRIWLYYAEVGGGHKAPAKAIAAELQKRIPSARFTWVDYGGKTGMWFKKWYEASYAFLVHSAEWIYILLYQLAKVRLCMWLFNTLSAPLLDTKLVRSLQQEKPDLIVATYFLLGPLVRAIQKSGLHIPLAVVVTDPYTAPPIWFFYRQLTYLVASEGVKSIALQAGVPNKQIRVIPQIINTSERSAPVDLQKTKQKTILLVGGANGFPAAEKIVRELLQKKLSVRIVVVCGENTKLAVRVAKLKKESDQAVVVYGYVDFLPALISISDVVVAKAGANVVHEVLAKQKPLILSHYIWGQERGNKDFVVANGLGFYEPRPTYIPKLVEKCLFDETTKKQLAAARKKITIQNGVSEAVCILETMLKG